MNESRSQPQTAVRTPHRGAQLEVTGHDLSEQIPVARKRRPRGRRQLCCPAHPEQRIEGNGQKYFLHLLTPEQLRARGMSDKRARLVIQAYPVLVLSNEWLEELFCAACGCSRWCHVIKHDPGSYTVRWAAHELWEQVAHVDPLVPNPTVGEFTRRQARHRGRRAGGRGYFDRDR